ncbi:hypothetical protein F5884DRAFT_378042 [Xylogone sp. PMI_703]|nr:hypothetical protein F5884DRAFT_378042 [Xylogone sp. PMI_703]
MSSSTSSTIESVPAPWKLKATIYTFFTFQTASQARNLPASFLYSPLERRSDFAKGEARGGLGMAQVLRYSESPVGPYDELLIVPGNYEYEAEVRDKKKGMKMEKRSNLRVTRIYVSTRESCYNGRKNWNIPKHLARFSFKQFPNNSVHIAVYPYDAGSPGNESTRSKTPLFSAVYKPVRYTPSFPFSTSLLPYLGIDTHLVQPPLPSGKTEDGHQEELVSTDRWCKSLPLEYSSKTSVGWWDLKQPKGDEEDALLQNGDTEPGNKEVSVYENWWPGMGGGD